MEWTPDSAYKRRSIQPTLIQLFSQQARPITHRIDCSINSFISKVSWVEKDFYSSWFWEHCTSTLRPNLMNQVGKNTFDFNAAYLTLKSNQFNLDNCKQKCYTVQVAIHYTLYMHTAHICIFLQTNKHLCFVYILYIRSCFWDAGCAVPAFVTHSAVACYKAVLSCGSFLGQESGICTDLLVTHT